MEYVKSLFPLPCLIVRPCFRRAIFPPNSIPEYVPLREEEKRKPHQVFQKHKVEFRTFKYARPSFPAIHRARLGRNDLNFSASCFTDRAIFFQRSQTGMPHKQGANRGPELRRLLGRRQSEEDGLHLVLEERQRYIGASRGSAQRDELLATRYLGHSHPNIRVRGE